MGGVGDVSALSSNKGLLLKLSVLAGVIGFLVSVFVAIYFVVYEPVRLVNRFPFLTEWVVDLTPIKNTSKLQLLDKPDDSLNPMWTFAVIGHSRSSEENIVNPQLKKAFHLSKDKKVDVVFLAGDVIAGFNANLNRYKKDIDALAVYLDTITIPVYVAPGNHDYSTKEQKAYFEEKFNKTYMRIARGTVEFMLLDTMDWHSKIFSGREFQFNYHSKSDRGYFVLPIPGNSDKYKPLTKEQYRFFKKVIVNLNKTGPREEDFFELPRFIGIIMHHRQWMAGEKHDWYKRWHPLLKGQNAFVFCGDYNEKNEFAVIDGVHYMNTAINHKKPGFMIGRFYKGKGLYLTQAFLDGKEEVVQFKNSY